jgi:hypothetical protein
MIKSTSIQRHLATRRRILGRVEGGEVRQEDESRCSRRDVSQTFKKGSEQATGHIRTLRICAVSDKYHLRRIHRCVKHENPQKIPHHICLNSATLCTCHSINASSLSRESVSAPRFPSSILPQILAPSHELSRPKWLAQAPDGHACVAFNPSCRSWPTGSLRMLATAAKNAAITSPAERERE